LDVSVIDSFELSHIKVTWLLQVYLPSASADGSVDGLSLWTLVPFLNLSLLKRNVAKAKREKQLANRQLKQTANKPVTRLALLIQIAYGQIDSNLSSSEPHLLPVLISMDVQTFI